LLVLVAVPALILSVLMVTRADPGAKPAPDTAPTPVHDEPAAHVPLGPGLPAGGAPIAAGTPVYEVHKKATDFPEREDLSTPEAAYASIVRAYAGEGSAAFLRLSVPELAARMPRSDKQPLAKDVADRFLSAEILEVHVWEETRAVVIARAKDGRGREYFDLRSLERVKGQWLNKGNDARNTLERARQKAAA